MKENIIRKIDDLDEDELKELLIEYDKYIQDANDEDRYKDEWYPVCIEEFLNNDLLEILEGKQEYLK